MAESSTTGREHAGTFADDAEGRSYVSAVEIDGDRFPPTVTLLLTRNEIPPGIHDLLDHYQASIVDAAAGAEGLHLTVRVGEKWKDAGTREIREHGNSLVLTLPREALDAARLGQQAVDLHARDGEVHIKKHQGGPRFPSR